MFFCCFCFKICPILTKDCYLNSDNFKKQNPSFEGFSLTVLVRQSIQKGPLKIIQQVTPIEWRRKNVYTSDKIMRTITIITDKWRVFHHPTLFLVLINKSGIYNRSHWVELIRIRITIKMPKTRKKKKKTANRHSQYILLHLSNNQYSKINKLFAT